MCKYLYGDDEDNGASTNPLKPDYKLETLYSQKIQILHRVRIEDKPVFSNVSIKVAFNVKIASNILIKI